MYHSYFGKLGQLRFPKPEDYYRFLGFLAHADIKVVYEYRKRLFFEAASISQIKTDIVLPDAGIMYSLKRFAKS